MQATRSAIVSVFIIACLLSLALITFYSNYGPRECHEGSFLCNRSDVCIANKYKCNNFRDCLHGEDESPQTCGDFFGGINYIGKALGCIKINKAIKNMNSSTSCALKGYPAECECLVGTSLHCNNVGLTKVPGNVSDNVKKMLLLNNDVVLFNDSFDGYYSLIVIHLRYNGLSRIPPFIFKHQNQLQKLVLSNNKLRTLEKDALYGLNSVECLFLGYNYLEFLNLNSWQHMTELTILYLFHNSLTFETECFPYLKNLTFLHLQWNRIETISECMFAELPSLRQVNLDNNAITVIHPNAFQNSIDLVELSISNNRITIIAPETLHPLKSITRLDLGNNPIKLIKGELFSEMKNLSSLDMKGIDKENIEMMLFDNLTRLHFLYLKEFHYCVLYAKHVSVCEPNIGDLSSSLNLLPNPLLQWTLWTVTVSTLIMNLMVLYGRMFGSIRDENQAINFVIRNLAVSDLLMVVYLTAIGYQNLTYENKYYLYAQEWESSIWCTVIGMSAVISSEVSMLILVFISLERFLLIAVPLSGYQVLKLKTAVYCMAAIWLVGISLSITPLLLSKHSSKFYGSNGLCYPLYIEDPFVDGWQYSAFMFLGLHTASLVLMSVLYALMFMSVRRTRKAARISTGDYDFAVRFFFIVLANSMCWLPIMFLKFAALRRYHISSKTYGWVITFVIPINSLLNPLLYTFTTPKYRSVVTSKNVFKIIYDHLSSGIKMETITHPLGLYIAQFSRKDSSELDEKEKDKSNTQESSFNSTNGGE